ncbi:WD40 repeat protein [Methanolinea mesophila]|uniref:WD40 repeat domain-containing protein n=1 Tax=Methanolinea mesophila TaxID=547055 RepID=UPI001AE52910|nr:WD40 repeat domain-containing protein [Methanolinea mesophila]MBP1928374.1 WD40 repeat protein [Methanolinea mesophila]
MARGGGKLLLVGVLIALLAGSAQGTTLDFRWEEGIPGISGLALSDDGSRVMVGTNTGQVRVYDPNGSVCMEVRVPGTAQVGILQNGSAYLVASQEDREKNKGTLRLFDAEGDAQWFWNSGWITSMDFCQGTDRIVTGDRAGNVVMLDGGGLEVRTWNDLPKTYIIADLALSADGKYFAYALEESNPQVKFVTVSSGSKKSFAKDFAYTGTYGYLEPIRQIELSGDGAYIATAGGEGSHGVLNFYARNGTRLWSKDLARINDLALDGQGGCVFIAGGDGNVSCYNRSGDLEWAYQSGAPAGRLSYAPGAGVLAAGNDEGDLRVFDRNGTIIWQHELDVFPTGAVTRMEFSSDGRALAVVANDRVLEYFETVSEPVVAEEISFPEVNATSPDNFTSVSMVNITESNGEETFLGFFPFPWKIAFPKLW